MRIAINGVGRIGRIVLKLALEKGLDVVAVNNISGAEELAYLVKYDSVYGNYDKNVDFGKDFIEVDGRKIKVFTEKDPANLPWKKLGVDIVVEATGLFRRRKDSSKHLRAGAKRVVISATSESADITIVPGVNDNLLNKKHKIISMASCTTNCLAPVAKVLNDNFGIKKGFMTTVHAVTSSQEIIDSSHRKPRRGRSGFTNIVPTTSGATEAVGLVIPKLKGKLNGLAMRVPVACGSIVDLVVELNKKASAEEINNALKDASENELTGILGYTEDEIVSSDIIKNPHSSVVDGLSTQVIGNMVKVLSWYDNEYGYSNRVVEMLERFEKE